MAGHNKWNNIKNRKGAQDQRKSRYFFLVAKQIRVAVKERKDGNPDTNPVLRLAIEKARQVNMPKENVQRAIDRGLGRNAAGESVQEVVYEGYGPHGVAFLVTAYTNNLQRTGGEVRNVFTHNGGALSGPGSASFLFTREETGFVPTMPLTLSDEQAEEVRALYDALNELDDTEDVFVSLQWPPDLDPSQEGSGE